MDCLLLDCNNVADFIVLLHEAPKLPIENLLESLRALVKQLYCAVMHQYLIVSALYLLSTAHPHDRFVIAFCLAFQLFILLLVKLRSLVFETLL